MSATSYLTLSQLQARIKSTLSGEFTAPVWITAEIGELKVNCRSGHCYMQLVEKGGRNGVPQAQASAVIWAGQYGMLSSYFRGATGEELVAGMNVLLSVTVIYHELYGLSLRIVDIDPMYTIGDLEQQRQRTIAQLKDDGVFDLNRELGIPVVPQRIAVVSSPQAAGYRDFMKELGASAYRFDTVLFSAVMQGHGAENAIIESLGAIAQRAEEFDAVVIIRGGGSQSDLSFLNSYLLSFHIAQFPLPVIAGLGHDKDQSVIDMVAALSLKTPTAVAAFLVDRAAGFDGRLAMFGNEIRSLASRILERESKVLTMDGALLKERTAAVGMRLRWRLQTLGESVEAGARRIVGKEDARLQSSALLIKERSARALSDASTVIEQAERLLAVSDPRTLLSRGFAIVRVGGKAVTDSRAVKKGDVLEITLHEGRLTAKVMDDEK